MLRNKPREPILIRDEGGIQTFRDPETGKEYSATVSRPIEGMHGDSRPVGVKCVIRLDREIAPQLAELRSVTGSDLAVSNRQLLSEARTNGSVLISGLRIWRAKEIVAAMKELGYSAELIRD
jgi:hypothetical protein